MKEFWEAEHARIGRGPVPVDSDPYLYRLEDSFIVRQIERFRPRSLLDVGCGNGRRTARFAELVGGPVLGIDYSPTAIRYAKELEDRQLRFRLGDFETARKLRRTFDCVLTCRALINLPDTIRQVRAIEALIRPLRRGGLLLIMEASLQGQERLNGLRGRLGLPPIGSVWHNALLDENAVARALDGSAEVLERTRFGLHYVLTRVLLPLVKRHGGGLEDATFRCSAELQEVLRAGEGIDEFGRHLAMAARKNS